jgi:hypothetical protein
MNPVISKLLSALVQVLTSRSTRQAFGLTPERVLGKQYGRLLQAVSSQIKAAGWRTPKGFDNHDRVVVYWYTLEPHPRSQLNYRELNTLLRTGRHRHAADLWLLAVYLYEALSKLPRRTQPSYRVASPFAGFESLYQPGNVFTERAFVSSSRNPRPAFSGDLYFSIRGHSGRLLAPLPHFSLEDEVLFLAGTTFEVLNIEELSDGSVHICLEEKK